MAAPNQKSDWKGWLTLALAVVVAVGSATAWLAHQFSEIDKHIARIETAVRIIGAKQGGDTQTLVSAALQAALSATDTGHPEAAKKAVAISNRLLSDQIAQGTPVSQSSITATFLQYEKLRRVPALQTQAHEGMLNLATYHSQAAYPQNIPLMAQIGEEGRIGRFNYFKNSVFVGEGSLATGPNREMALDDLALRMRTPYALGLRGQSRSRRGCGSVGIA
jgi:hypothetical protein